MTCTKPAAGWPALGVFNVTVAASTAGLLCSSSNQTLVRVSQKPSVAVSGPATFAVCATARNVTLAYLASAGTGSAVDVNATASAAGVKCSVSAQAGELVCLAHTHPCEGLH